MKIPDFVLQVVDVLTKWNVEVYYVGGCVRDSLLKKDAKDWDLAVDVSPDMIQKIFSNFKDEFYVVPLGAKFGTVTVISTKEKLPYSVEITTFRTDSGYSDGRHPDTVAFCGTILEDLERRDFTMNAIAVNAKTLEMIDPYQGAFDILNKTIHCVSCADDRFQEDALRMLRAIRFSVTLGFTIEEETWKSIERNHKLLLMNVSMERIREELLKMLTSPRPGRAVDILHHMHILEEIMPEFKDMHINQKTPWHKYTVFTHTLYTLENVPATPIFRMAALLHDIGKPVSMQVDVQGIGHFYGHEFTSMMMASQILKKLKFSIKDQREILYLIECHMVHLKEDSTVKAIRNFIAKHGTRVKDLLTFTLADRIASGVKSKEEYTEEIERITRLIWEVAEMLDTIFSMKDMKISGEDLIALFPLLVPGPWIGATLKELFQRVVDNPKLNTFETLRGMSLEIHGCTE